MTDAAGADGAAAAIARARQLVADAVWLPREDQLRELLRATFRSLTRLDDAFEVEVEVAGSRMRFEHPDVAEAYGLALLELIGRSR